MSPRMPYTCLQCRLLLQAPKRTQWRSYTASGRLLQAEAPRPSTAPKPSIDLRHIRQNPELYEQNCIERNYRLQSTYPARINKLFEQWQAKQHEARSLRERNNLIKGRMANPISERNTEAAMAAGILDMTQEQLLQEARKLKEQLSSIEVSEDRLQSEIDALALALPNFTSDETPRGDEPKVLGYINDHPEPNPSQSDRVWRSHSHIGSELSLLDFSSAATTSGWGWYNLLNGGALLEQALIQYAISVALSHKFTLVIPPSIVYSHIAAACGFQPRDQNDEMQIYALQQPAADVGKKPELCLAGTAEIPLAGMFAKSTVDAAALPIKRAAVSRCYRAEAGARGVDTKGLYRVHEFTKIELFGWTTPSLEAAMEVFNEIVSIQKTILENLGLHCRILEQPSTDLGASAIRKIDIEAFFPSRRQKGDGFGEVTSASICTDYQTRRLATRLQRKEDKLGFPFTVNGTAIAVPRVLAAILENGWDEERKTVKVPKVLWPWMHGIKEIKEVKRVSEED